MMQFNSNEHATENMVAMADDMAEYASLRESEPMTIEEEDRAYIALKNRRTIAHLLALRGIAVPAMLND